MQRLDSSSIISCETYPQRLKFKIIFRRLLEI